MKHITVCWNCKRNDLPLRVIRDNNGKKTKDYICQADYLILGLAKPPIGNSSTIRV